MKKLRPLIVTLALLAACTRATPAGSWDGEYTYSGYGGRTAGGSAISMEITVSINSPKFKQACVLQASGSRRKIKSFAPPQLKATPWKSGLKVMVMVERLMSSATKYIKPKKCC